MKKYNEEELNEKKKRESIEKAREVASKSQEIVDNNYEKFIQKVSRIVKKINSRVDFFILNSLSAKIISLILAIILYVSITSSGDVNVTTQANVGKNVYGVKVIALYDKTKYQVDNLPETVDLSLIGSLDQIRKTEDNNKLEVIADLTNYKPGVNQKVDLLYSGVANNVDVKFSQPSYEVNIYQKEKKEFKVTPQFVKENNNYSYEANLTKNTVTISAASHTLNSIESVYVLIDVDKKTKSFVSDAKIVAFDKDGNIINNLTTDSDNLKVEVTIVPLNKGGN
ncbi:MAG: hypothetical protein LBR40_01145 [Bacilli bacterium]|jgi:YbbR domain-containing protein|nr:hypothetical protein [Bacilli bacterium]